MLLASLYQQQQTLSFGCFPKKLRHSRSHLNHHPCHPSHSPRRLLIQDPQERSMGHNGWEQPPSSIPGHCIATAPSTTTATVDRKACRSHHQAPRCRKDLREGYIRPCSIFRRHHTSFQTKKLKRVVHRIAGHGCQRGRSHCHRCREEMQIYRRDSPAHRTSVWTRSGNRH